MKKTDKMSPGKVRIFGTLKILIFSALLSAMSIIFGKLLAINPTDYIRISFENLPILLAGIMFGPLVGGSVGIIADILGCIIAGYSIIPIITVGAFSIGFISGFMTKYLFGNKSVVSVICSVYTAHIIGSMIIKSVGMYLWMKVPVFTLFYRIPVYIVIGAAEAFIIILLVKNKAFNRYSEVTVRK